eukprot:PhM_4_TR1684/c0_g1_i1/m.74869
MKLNSGVVATTKGQRIVPEELRKELFHKWHGSDTIGHMGANRLYGLMNRHFYWPKMKVDIKKWTRECAACDKLRGPPRKVRLNPQLGVDVLKQWQVDLATMPKSKSGNNQLLALADVGSRFPFAFALKDTDATTLINVITREVMPFIGVPEVVHTDNGQQFASKMWEAVFGSMGVKTRYSPVYSPQGKGIVERLIREIKERTTSRIDSGAFSVDEWDSKLPYVLWGIRSTAHEGGISPSEALMGVRSLLPCEPRAPPRQPGREMRENAARRFEVWRSRLSEMRKQFQSQLDNQATVRAAPTRVEAEVPSFGIGDRVLFTPKVTAEGASLGKTLTGYQGPYVIEEVFDHGVCVCRHEGSGKTSRYHIRSLKKATSGEIYPISRTRWGLEEDKHTTREPGQPESAQRSSKKKATKRAREEGERGRDDGEQQQGKVKKSKKKK